MDYTKHLIKEGLFVKGDKVRVLETGEEGVVVKIGANTQLVQFPDYKHANYGNHELKNLQYGITEAKSNKVGTKGEGGIRVGDRVKITAKVKGLPTSKLGTVESIDGSYFYILPDGRKKGEIIELYYGEFKKI